jgi:hypothetical protein
MIGQRRLARCLMMAYFYLEPRWWTPKDCYCPLGSRLSFY